MQRDNLSDTLLSILHEFGMSLTPFEDGEPPINGIPAEVTLRRRKSLQTYTVISALSKPEGSALARKDQLIEASRDTEERRLLLVADRLNARTMAACRSRKIDYVDRVGNALIRFGDVYIDVRGRSLNADKATSETRHAPVNLFSARRAQVIFALIVWPELFTLPIRYTSEAAGVSIGSAFQTTKLLKESGYIIGESEPYMVRKGELIDRWTDAFATGLKNKLVIAQYRGEHLDVLGSDPGVRWFVSGECAVRSLLRPTTLTIYVDELRPELIAANRWRRDGNANVEVRKKFWKDPQQILNEDRGLGFIGFAPEAPTLLIYADLMASGDGRQREAATAFRNLHHELVGG